MKIAEQEQVKSGLWGILSNRNLRWYWMNAIISSFGDNASSIALLLLVLDATGSVSYMATMSIVVAVPGIVLGVLSGVWVDRWEARRVIIVSQALRAVTFLVLIQTDFSLSLLLIFTVAFAQSTIGTFDDPARARLLQSLATAEQRLQVNSVTQTGSRIAGVAGTMIGGFLAGSLDVYWPAFVLAFSSFVVGAVSISKISGEYHAFRAGNDESRRPSFRDEVLTGLYEIRKSRTLSAVMISASISALGTSAATIVLLPLLTEVLNINPGWFGIVEAAQTGAMILASLSLAFLGNKVDPKLLVPVAMAGIGASFVALGTASGVVLVIATMFVVGCCITPLGAGYSTLLMNFSRPSFIGRIAATMNTLIQTSGIVSMGVAGLLSDSIGIRETMWAAGGISIVAAIVCSVLLRNSEEPPSDPA